MSLEIRHQDALTFEFGQLRRPDVMIVDPPYSAHVHKNASTMKGNVAQSNDLGFVHLSPKLRRKIASYAAQVNTWSLIYTDTESVAYWKISLEAAGAEYIRCIPWVRWSIPQLSGDRPPQGSESLIVAHSGKRPKEWWGLGNLTHLDHLALRGEGKHKAEKPLDQLLDLVWWFTPAAGENSKLPTASVFDPTSGSGTTGQACRLLNRRFLGFELQESWVVKSQKRLVEPLSERDLERYNRWLVSRAKQERDRERMRNHTDSVV